MEPNKTDLSMYISDGQSALINLKKMYDTILVTNNNSRDSIYRIPYNDIFLKYQKEFDDAAQYYVLPNLYMYKPKSVSLELYGTTELWLALLRLNKMRNITEFKGNIIKVYQPDKVHELIQIFFKREQKIF
jgi:hypothetical protein